MHLLELKADTRATFLTRINKYLAEVEINGRKTEVHVHDPGRLKELLYNGNTVLLKYAANPKRKTKWDILAARFNDYWVFVHSGYHRLLSEAILRSEISPFGKISQLKAEVKSGNSRLDFLLSTTNGNVWLEVKGCTLLDSNNRALFPDAPTERGLRHIVELTKIVREGENAAVMVLVFHQSAKCFAPNSAMHKAFADAFYEAINAGIKVYPVRITYDGNYLNFDGVIPLCNTDYL